MDHGKREVDQVQKLHDEVSPNEDQKNPAALRNTLVVLQGHAEGGPGTNRGVEAFLDFDTNRDKWASHLRSARTPLGPLRNIPLSFGHPLVRAHFQFALFVLNVLAEINTIFQEKYAFVPYLWEYVESFEAFVRDELPKIENGDFSRFPYLAELEPEAIGQFSTILKSSS